MTFKIERFTAQTSHREAAACMLNEVFDTLGKFSWPTVEEAAREVEECLEAPNVLVGAVSEGELLGWAGIRPLYDVVWEVHPVVVAGAHQGRGVGRALMLELETIARDAGAIGLHLGADDITGSTSLSRTDLTKDNLLEAIRDIRNLNHHPYEFYAKLGYFITGVVPDANGRRKPDIFMWKSLVPAR